MYVPILIIHSLVTESDLLKCKDLIIQLFKAFQRLLEYFKGKV